MYTNYIYTSEFWIYIYTHNAHIHIYIYIYWNWKGNGVLFLQYALFLSILCDQMWTICIIMYLLVFRYTYLHICIYIYIQGIRTLFTHNYTTASDVFTVSPGNIAWSSLVFRAPRRGNFGAANGCYPNVRNIAGWWFGTFGFEILLVGGVEHLDYFSTYWE